MVKILAKKFQNRAVLDKVAEGADPKLDVIEGTAKELALLALDDQTIVNGIKCVLTDKFSVQQKIMEKPFRGETFKSKINNKIIIDNEVN